VAGIANFVGRKSAELVHPLNVLEDSGLITRQADPFHGRRSAFRITEPLITFYQAVMRNSWAQLEQRQGAAVSRRQPATFMSQVVGPHFEFLCRESAAHAGEEVFGDLPAEVCAGAVTEPVGRAQIEVEVAVLGSGTPGEPRRILSLGEAKWGKGLRTLAASEPRVLLIGLDRLYQS
jgi:hypothetical protein